MIQTITLHSGKDIDVSVSWTDWLNQSAEVSGPTTWLSSDDLMATVTIDTTDSSKANIKSVGPTGIVQIKASAPTTSGGTAVALLVVTVTSGEAVTGTIYQSGGMIPPPTPR